MNYDRRLESLPANLINIIARIDELKGRWVGGRNLSPQVVDSLRRSTLITSAGASTRIEGSKMTDKDVKDFLSGLKIQKFAERDRQEVSGYYESLEFIFSHFGELPLTENSIKHLHAQLLQYSTKDRNHRGSYKTMDNKVEATDESGNLVAIVFETTPAYLVNKEMSELVDWSVGASEHHTLLVLANFIVTFLKIHPFLDGNGRLSRLLTNYWLLRAGYEYTLFVSYEKLIEESKSAYYQALRGSQVTFGRKGESITTWVEYFLRVLLTQAEQAIKLLDVAMVEDRLSPKQLIVWRYLGQVDRATPGQISQQTKVARMTVAQALVRLVDLGLVVRSGQGRTTFYRRKG